jgi:DNA-binding response OmpR family regulator
MHETRRGRHVGSVLIVEPHDDSRAMYADYFAWNGFHVTAVRTAAGALRHMSHERHDAVITCLRLRDMDGFALRAALAASRRTSQVPVIAVCSCASDHQRAFGDAGFAAVLMKPCLPDVLLSSVRDALAGQCLS